MNDSGNPYNCSRPGNLFVGYSGVLGRMLRGLTNGKSYAVLGGRRCGKTSFLLKLEQNLKQAPDQNIFPRILDMQAVVPRSPADFFGAIYATAVQGIEAQVWNGAHYQDFLSSLDRTSGLIEQRYGPNWVDVLLIDELDSGASKLPDSECFQNLRNLLMNSRYSRHFRVVATGVSSLSELITDRTSPLNNLDPEYLGILPADTSRSLVMAGFPSGLPAASEGMLFERSGRHPYILQGMLEYLWDYGQEVNEVTIGSAAQRFVRDRAGTFRRWLHDFRSEGRAVYDVLSNATVTAKELRARIPKTLSVDEGLGTLSYHGVLDESSPGAPQVSGTIFRNWFRDNCELDQDLPTSTLETTKAQSSTVGENTRIFVVHGRNEGIRGALFIFLRALGLEPLEWTTLVEATKHPAPHVGEILRTGFGLASAVIVLLTPDDEARLREELRKPDDPEYESALNPQPRPNVLFEAGMAMAHFSNRTVFVQVGSCRPFSDIAGIHFVKMDNSVQKRRDLAKLLKMAGCGINDLDSNGDWQKAGDFALAPSKSSGATANS